ncbi:zinc finger protein 618-like [Mustelus asterias]
MSSLDAAIKTENRDEESEVHAELWQDESKDHKSNKNAREVAEICVVIGEDGAQRCSEQDQPKNQSSEFDGQPGKPNLVNDKEENMEWKPQQQASLRAYICGACGKKYKYYSCFRAHVRAHLENETSSASAESSPQTKNFRYMCDICGKKYKYYSCFQEHRDLHAVDGMYLQSSCFILLWIRTDAIQLVMTS